MGFAGIVGRGLKNYLCKPACQAMLVSVYMAIAAAFMACCCCCAFCCGKGSKSSSKSSSSSSSGSSRGSRGSRRSRSPMRRRERGAKNEKMEEGDKSPSRGRPRVPERRRGSMGDLPSEERQYLHVGEQYSPDLVKQHGSADEKEHRAPLDLKYHSPDLHDAQYAFPDEGSIMNEKPPCTGELMALLRTLEGKECLGKNVEGEDPDDEICGLKATTDVTDPDLKVVKSMKTPALSRSPTPKEKAKVVKSSGAKAGGPKPHGIGRGGSKSRMGREEKKEDKAIQDSDDIRAEG